METIGIHYQTWKNRPAVEFVLENLRKHYPEAPVRMISDNGEDFTDLAKKYGCSFEHSNINIFPKGVLAGHPSLGGEANYIGAKVWLERLYTTCLNLTTDWIVVFEDDVLTHGRIKNFPRTHAAGVINFPFKLELIQHLYAKHFRHNTTGIINDVWGYGMCGGSIFRRDFYIEGYEKYIQEFDIEYLARLDDRVGGWSDVLLTVFMIYCGGTYQIWDELEDKLLRYPPKKYVAFEHNVKEHYNIKQGAMV
jgi:hypothetical protein